MSLSFSGASRVQITLTTKARVAAALAMWFRNLLAFRKALAYTGPDFGYGDKDIVGVAMGVSTVNVVLNGSIEYVYPLHSVGRIKITN